MTTYAEHQAAPNAEADDEAKTGLPGVATWRGVYGWVLVVFVLIVSAMSVFGWMFT